MLCFIGWIEQGNAVSGLFLLVLRRRSAVSARRTVGATFAARVLRSAIPLERWFGIKSRFAVSLRPPPLRLPPPLSLRLLQASLSMQLVCLLFSPPPPPRGGNGGSEQSAVFLRLVCSAAPIRGEGAGQTKFFRRKALTNYTVCVIIFLGGDEQSRPCFPHCQVGLVTISLLAVCRVGTW